MREIGFCCRSTTIRMRSAVVRVPRKGARLGLDVEHEGRGDPLALGRGEIVDRADRRIALAQDRDAAVDEILRAGVLEDLLAGAHRGGELLALVVILDEALDVRAEGHRLRRPGPHRHVLRHRHAARRAEIGQRILVGRRLRPASRHSERPGDEQPSFHFPNPLVSPGRILFMGCGAAQGQCRFVGRPSKPRPQATRGRRSRSRWRPRG